MVRRLRTKTAKKSTVAALKRDVKMLKKDVRDRTQIHHLASEINSTLGSASGAQMFVANLCNWSAATPIFGSSNTDVDLANSYVHRGFGLDVYVTNNDESQQINYTAFLVSLKDNIGSAFDPNTGALTLTNPLHFYNNSSPVALTMLNKNCFNIHKIKRFTLGNMGVGQTVNGLQTQYGNAIRWYWKIRADKKVSCPTQSMKTQQSSLDPSKNYYLLISNDNSTLDLEVPIVRGTIVHSIQVNM